MPMLKPYYSEGKLRLYLGDARAIIPELLDEVGSVDLLLTDPPYGVEGGKGGDSKRGKADYQEQSWEDTPDYIYDLVVPVVSDCLIHSDRGIITPGTRNVSLYPAPDDMGCLWTPASVSHGPWGFVTFHPVLYYGLDPRRGRGALPSGKRVNSSSKVTGHPCPKPLDAWKWLMEKGSIETSDLILDPFVGSGTTLVAAKELGRTAIGIEISEKFCEIAVSEIQKARVPLF